VVEVRVQKLNQCYSSVIHCIKTASQSAADLITSVPDNRPSCLASYADSYIIARSYDLRAVG
jgi:hypothetical protein